MKYFSCHTRSISQRNAFTVRGFTLMEVLVALAVLLIILAISMAGFREYARKQTYSAIVDRVRNDISLMRQKTLASYDDTVYGVYVGVNTIEFFKGISPEVGSSSNTIINFRDYGITATSTLADGEWYVTFSRLTGEPSTEGVIVLEDLNSSASTTLTILGSGIVE